jgi:hypothetical protein
MMMLAGHPKYETWGELFRCYQLASSASGENHLEVKDREILPTHFQSLGLALLLIILRH